MEAPWASRTAATSYNSFAQLDRGLMAPVTRAHEETIIPESPDIMAGESLDLDDDVMGMAGD